jgi:hypothetical protein
MLKTGIIKVIFISLIFLLVLSVFKNGSGCSDMEYAYEIMQDSVFHFDSTGSSIYMYENERDSFLQNTFFDDIKAYPSSSTSLKKISSLADGVQNTFLQISMFRSNEPNTYYFMIVNRRCSPYVPDSNENGGRRFIRIKFDKGAETFSHFHDWKITNVSNKSEVIKFNRTDTGYINLKWFMPCEGKLYKIAPSILGK